jgi:hypothetical protein
MQKVMVWRNLGEITRIKIYVNLAILAGQNTNKRIAWDKHKFSQGRIKKYTGKICNKVCSTPQNRNLLILANIG